MSNPLFSIIIPTFNRKALIGPTLDSVFAQELTDYEILIVDDGSTDGTLDVVRGYGDRVRVIPQDHKGCAAARNLGARHAVGEYLAFLDSDDLWFPWTLALFAEVIAAHDSPTIVAGNLWNFSDPARVAEVERMPAEVAVGDDYLQAALPNGFALGVAHTVVRREAYLQVDGCLERNINGTDSDVLLKMGDAPGFAIIKSPPTLAYRQHSGATTVNYQKGFDGARMLIEQERVGAYPGGPDRRNERLDQVLIRTRAISLLCLQGGRRDLGWRLYRETLAWNLRRGRWRYLASLPLMAAFPPLLKLIASPMAGAGPAA